MEVTIYESLFNKFARSLYKKGALNTTKQVNRRAAKAVFKTLQFFRQPFGLKNPLNMEVGLTEVPIIHISQKDGISVNARARVRVFKLEANKIKSFKTPKHIFSVSARSKVDVKIAITKKKLTVYSPKFHCKIETKNWFRKAILKRVEMFLISKVMKILDGVKIPLPKVVDFSQVKIDHYDGYMMVTGSLDVSQAGVKMVEDKFEKLMKHV